MGITFCPVTDKTENITFPHAVMGCEYWNIQCSNMSLKSVVYWADVGTSETRQLYDIGNLAAVVDCWQNILSSDFITANIPTSY